MRIATVVLAVLCLVVAPVRAQEGVDAGIASLVERGQDAFREATSLREDDPRRARELYGRAIGAWSEAMDRGGFANGKLHYNIANAHLLRDEVGEAVLHYTYAKRLLPNDRNIASNLARARARVPGGGAGDGAGGAMETLLFFHYGMTQRTRLTVALVAFALTFLLAGFVTLRRLPRGALWFAGVASLVWIATGASLAADLSDTTRRGVIVGGEVVGRKGPDASGYEPSFTAPLLPGIEFELIETRGEWLYVRLRDGRTTWVPTRAVSLVDSLAPGGGDGSSI